MQSIPEYFRKNYPSESVPEPQSGPAAGEPQFAVPGGQTSADSTPQPPVDLPPGARPNNISETELGAYEKLSGGAGYHMMGPGLQAGNYQFEFSSGPDGNLTAQVVNKDEPAANPYPHDKSTPGSRT